MSLQLVAKHLSQKGRGPDSTLVHMSPKEVGGLQALAKKHGGSLTVNPQTGLPEAGFLDDVLPAVAGAALNYAFPGLGTLGSAAIVGGIKALDSKDLGKGLMAGLGAWGGASLSGGLMGAGAASSAAAQEAGVGAAHNAFMPESPSGWDKLGGGVSELFKHPSETLSSIGGGNPWKAAGYLGAAAAPILADQGVQTTTKAPITRTVPDYEFVSERAPYDPNLPSTAEQKYFNQYYKKTGEHQVTLKGGGLVALADGGYTAQNSFNQPTPLPENSMTGGSRQAYDYLMGGAGGAGGWQTGGTQPPIGGQFETPEGSGHYEYDQATGNYKWIKDPVIDPIAQAPIPNATQIENRGGNGGREPEDPNSFTSQWAAMSDAEKDAWRAENPKTAAAQDFVKYALVPGGMVLGGIQSLYKNMVGPDVSNPASTGMTGLPNSDPIAIANTYEQDKAANPLAKDPATLAAEKDAAIKDLIADSDKSAGWTTNPVTTPTSSVDAEPVGTADSGAYMDSSKNAGAPGAFTSPVKTVDVQPTATFPSTSTGTEPQGGPIGSGYPDYKVQPTTSETTTDSGIAALSKVQKEAEERAQAIANQTPEQAQTAGLAFMGVGPFLGTPPAATSANEGNLGDAAAATHLQNILAYTPAPAPAPTPAPTPAPAAEPTIPVNQTWNGEDRPSEKDGWSQVSAGQGDTKWVRTVNVPMSSVTNSEGGVDLSRLAGTGWGSYGNTVSSNPNGDGRADVSGIGGTTYGSVAAGYTGGSEAAAGGLSTPYGFRRMAHGGIADLHQYNLGSYSDGGRLLKGPGDGVSDDIPATIGHGQPARLADGEFVIPARIVSELGNGSTDAGARELYKMMDRIQAGRKKTVGKNQVAKNSKAARHLPA